MRKLQIVLAGSIAWTVMVMPLHARFATHSPLGDKDVKLTGCLVKGEGDHGYLITNLPSEPASISRGGSVLPSAVGTTGSYSTIFYWLDDDHDLERHVGHLVEIEGALKGDAKGGEIKLERKDNWTEVRVKSDGRTMKAIVPNASIFPASRREKDRKVNAIVRRVDVDHIRMIAPRCE